MLKSSSETQSLISARRHDASDCEGAYFKGGRSREASRHLAVAVRFAVPGKLALVTITLVTRTNLQHPCEQT
eukprot:2378314-Pleurochrysis_carterae.AAC.4